MKTIYTFIVALGLTILIGMGNCNPLKAQDTKTYTDDSRKIIWSIRGLESKFPSERRINFTILFKGDYIKEFKDHPDRFKWTIKNLPYNATFGQDNALFEWVPNGNQVGPWKIVFQVEKDGMTEEVSAEFEVEGNWNSFYIPGVSFTNLIPIDQKNFGVFNGISVEYVIAAWIHKNENRGPSHGRFYLKLDVLRSNHKTDVDSLKVSDAFNYTLGLNMSLERNPVRSYMIPFFGFEMGGFYQKKFDNFFMIMPLAGVWIYSSQNVFVNLYAGYMLPTSGFESIRGLRTNLGFNFSLW